MKHADKVEYLQKHHWKEWINTRNSVDIELANSLGIFCFCGKLATGLHLGSCSKYCKQVEAKTVARLEHLIPKSQ